MIMKGRENQLRKAGIIGQENKTLAIRVLEWIEKVKKKHEPVFSFFLSPADQDIAQKTLNVSMGFSFLFFGGYTEAERKIVGIFPDWMEAEKELFPLCVIRCVAKEPLTHRDSLGSVLGLGLKRSVVGDVLISENTAYVVLNKRWQDYVMTHLKQIGRQSVQVDLVDLEVLAFENENGQEKIITVASERLDVFLAEGFGVSRSVASKWILAERVKVNHRAATQKNKVISCEDVISVRGKGRLVCIEFLEKTRKNRLRVKIKRF